MKQKKINPRLIVAGNVQRQMVMHGLTATAFAPKIGLTSSTLSKRMTGVVCFTADELFRIANYFRIPVAELLEQ